MPSLAIYCLPLAFLAIIQAAAPAEDNTALKGPSPRHTPLGLLLRKRSLAAAFKAPVNPSFFSDTVMEAPRKRQDDIWIWMPAHGYMSIPRDEIDDEEEDQSSLGNLMRYG